MREIYGVLDGLYVVGDTIGRGGFAKVKKATHIITGERVAIKILDKLALGEDLPRVAREIETLKTLNHPHICKLFHVLETDEKIFMVMEYCRGGELFDYIVQRDRLEEVEARKFFRQIGSAVAFIHSKGVAHRDLKPENILLDDANNVKLIDFGLCAVPVGGMKVELETCCGSPAYAAPELVKGERYFGPHADVWSLGILLYALLNGFLPFDDQNLGILYKKIQAGKYDEPKWLTEGSKNILRCMLQVNPHYRLSVEELLKHTWCQEGKPGPLPEIDMDPFQGALDPDILQLMSLHMNEPIKSLQSRLSHWNYNKYDTATYLILVSRRNRMGDAKFKSCPMRLERAPIHQNQNNYMNFKVQKSLEAEFDECDDAVDSNTALVPPARPYHSSMEGGLDDCCLLQLGSPKCDLEKENTAEDFALPKIPSPKKPKLPTPPASSTLSPARSADSGLNDIMKTPTREKWRNFECTPVRTGSPRRKVLGSIERGLDRVRLMLTPRHNNKSKKPKTITWNGNKAAFNVSATASTDPDCVISELKASFASIGIECEQKGYKLLIGKLKQNVKFELEVVAIENLDVIGIRRTRTHGDAWEYKRIIEQVLSLTGVCQLPRNRALPLSTMV